jgi:hypothetical protein
MIKAMRTAYTYNGSGKMELMETYYLMEEMEILFSKSLMTYNASGQLTVEEDWSFNYMSFTLEKSSRITTTYNASGDVSTEIWSDWDAGSQTWIDDEKDEYTYGSTNFSEVVYPSYFFLYTMIEDQSYTIQKIITEINTFEMVEGNWTNTDKSNYYYSSSTASNVDLVESSAFSVFPNPASEYVKVSWTGKYDILSLEIFRIDGSKVLEQPVHSGKIIPVSRLDRGVYFFRLVNGMETMYAGKLIRK